MDAKGELSRDTLLLRTGQEELLNTLTHGFGLLLSSAAATLLLTAAILQGQNLFIAGCAVYSLALVAVYAFSTLSHYARWPDTKRQFRMWDQGLIYFLIAGSYTPLATAFLPSGRWWLVFAVMWCFAICGFLSKILLHHRIDSASTISYIALAALQVPAMQPIATLAPASVVFWYGIGGLCYMIGVTFLILDRKVVYFHAIWHLFVIAGSACQFLAIYLYVVPQIG